MTLFEEIKALSPRLKIIGAISGLIIFGGAVAGITTAVNNHTSKSVAVPETLQVEYDEEAPSAGASEEGSVDEGPVLYTISRNTINNELKEFYQLWFGCYLNYSIGNNKTNPTNMSKMLEHTGIVGALVPAKGLKVVADYKDADFIFSNPPFLGVLPRGQFDYRVDTVILAANFENFKYYADTDSHLEVISEINYYIDNQLVDTGYAATVLVPNSDKPEEWLINMAALSSDKNTINSAIANLDKYVLIDEDASDNSLSMESLDIEALKAAVDVLPSDITKIMPVYIDGDDIPELVTTTAEMTYRNMESYLYKFDGTSYVCLGQVVTEEGYFIYLDRQNIIISGGGHMDYYYDFVTSINSNGELENVFSGSYEMIYENDNVYNKYYISGQEVSVEAYNEQLSQFFSYDDPNMIHVNFDDDGKSKEYILKWLDALQ